MIYNLGVLYHLLSSLFMVRGKKQERNSEHGQRKKACHVNGKMTGGLYHERLLVFLLLARGPCK